MVKILKDSDAFNTIKPGKYFVVYRQLYHYQDIYKMGEDLLPRLVLRAWGKLL